MSKASQKTAHSASVELPISCPAWCGNANCNGDHYSESDEYVPATASLPHRNDHDMGVSFPAVGIALAWGVVDNRPPAVSLHVNGRRVDTQADMQLHEAEELLKSLKRAVKTLRATCHE